MRTGAEPIAGVFAGSAFPAIPSVPLIFPFETGKHRAGVAELVDALVLGTSITARRINSLRSQDHWIVGANVRARSNPIANIYPITVDGIVADTCGIECPRGTVSMAHETLYATVADFKKDYPDEDHA